ncbi:hypothetical protein H0486_12120 [Lachnospiraceae bacterium MD1]|jgi:hypothetical protein|uniref:Uncharacterized protein n=1 Tax=Variimorphobacter saccharofermentans TaxID=2755051 RepID=A0A839K3M8_9FIRM|nr:hypothetical protein [Variimorphobacter saccharofermentans]MBB2183619.1 hypothetical protein [Variimorphobacter saccharofermentans]
MGCFNDDCRRSYYDRHRHDYDDWFDNDRDCCKRRPYPRREYRRYRSDRSMFYGFPRIFR